MEFSKMHGAGNDFIMINDMDESLRITEELITALCKRHFGVGADGVVILRPSREYDFTMLYFNSDGSRAGMCGNGARCAARFAINEEISGAEMVFQTDSGTVRGKIEEEEVEVSLGKVKGLRLNLELKNLRISYAEAGVPHVVIFNGQDNSVQSSDFKALARQIRYSEEFEPEGTNVNLVNITGDNSLSYRTYERGVEDETRACGTGAAAVSVIASHLGKVGKPVECRTAGGDILRINFEKEDYGASSCYLTGPAVETFRGRVDISAFNI